MKFFKFSIIILSILFPILVLGNNQLVIVRVGGYDFSPFVENEGREGVVKDLLYKLNSSQKKYRFEFVLTSPNRRYRDFKLRKFDIILFEDESWEWKKSGILYDRTPVLAFTSELVVALNDRKRNQKYFDDLTNKKVGQVLGYHYQYQLNGIDRKKQPEIVFGKTELENLSNLLEKKIDVTFINSALLSGYFKKNKELKTKFLIGKNGDYSAKLRGIIHPLSPIKIEELEKLGINKILFSNEL